MAQQTGNPSIAELKAIAAAIMQALEEGAPMSSSEEKALLECIAALQASYSDWLTHQSVKDRTFPH
jgi:hypothetical protein